jgi:hypothetical protein
MMQGDILAADRILINISLIQNDTLEQRKRKLEYPKQSDGSKIKLPN